VADFLGFSALSVSPVRSDRSPCYRVR